ncbi:hypothetical protein ABZV93_03050 [Actinopolymorpha sp. NPDC004070]|uniref:hypothetical protein n=1 Tax=Actinopolymorpha sp. NPDC004070 TaxID=3154548 RepID=UPI0033AB2309
MLTGNGARRVQRVLVGGSGVWAAALAWSTLVVLWVTVFLLGWLVLPAVAGLTVAAVLLTARFSAAWRPGRLLMLASLGVWAVCSVVVWWLWGVGFEAADTGRPMPAVMVLERPSFVLGAGAFLLFWAHLLAGVVHTRRAAPPTLASSEAAG